ncbi:transmembrane protein 200A isoform X2 [Mobula birostris]|uniref:transmembrane protein 200A isoform X2 n=1 Tax=Mobula birostris TaxID=1983395 RepID=UPI003B28537F
MTSLDGYGCEERSFALEIAWNRENCLWIVGGARKDGARGFHRSRQLLPIRPRNSLFFPSYVFLFLSRMFSHKAFLVQSGLHSLLNRCPSFHNFDGFRDAQVLITRP